MNLNKEVIKKILIAASIILLISIVGGLVASVNYLKKNKVEAFDEKVISQSFSNMDIDSDNYKIEILPTDNSQARVSVLANKNLVPTVTTKVSNDTLLIKIRAEKTFKLVNLGYMDVNVKIYLPAKSYNAITAKADNGNIHISELISNTVKVTSNDGYINLKNIKTESLKVTADNGKITFNDITSTDTTIGAKDGAVKGDYVTGKLNINANNGSINIRLAEIADHINLTSDDGNIKLKLDNKPTQTHFIAKSIDGSVKIPDSFQSTNGSLYTVTLNSDNGRIIVE